MNNNQNQQMTPTELAQTQVLNINEVEETVKKEKKTSKKPAIIIAIIGILLIAGGFSYPYIMGLINKKPASDNTPVAEETESTPLENLICNKTQPANPDGTDTTNIYTYTFNNNLLQKYTKTLTVTSTDNLEAGLAAMESLKSGYQALIIPDYEGYSLLINEENATLNVTVSIDLTTLNKLTLPEANKANFLTNVEYDLNTERSIIEENMTTEGYTCQ